MLLLPTGNKWRRSVQALASPPAHMSFPVFDSCVNINFEAWENIRALCNHLSISVCICSPQVFPVFASVLKRCVREDRPSSGFPSLSARRPPRNPSLCGRTGEFFMNRFIWVLLRRPAHHISRKIKISCIRLENSVRENHQLGRFLVLAESDFCSKRFYGSASRDVVLLKISGWLQDLNIASQTPTVSNTNNYIPNRPPRYR